MATDLSALGLQEQIGPAVVEEKACTTVILPGYVGVVDDYGNIVIEKNRSGG